MLSLVPLKRKIVVAVLISDHPTTMEAPDHKTQHHKLSHSNQMSMYLVCGAQRYGTKAHDRLFCMSEPQDVTIELGLSARFQSSRNAICMTCEFLQENYMIKLPTASNFRINPNSMSIWAYTLHSSHYKVQTRKKETTLPAPTPFFSQHQRAVRMT